MKNLISSFIVCALLLSACQTETNVADIIPDIGNETDIFNIVYNQNNIASQEFVVAANKDTTLVTSGGVTIRLFENSFVTSEGDSVEGDISIEFKEALTKKDFILGNLTTFSDGKILESNGMIYINATGNGNQLQLGEDKVIGIAVPTDTVLKDMDIYQGETCYSEDTPCENNDINWIEPEAPLNSQIKTEQINQRWVTYWPDFNATQDQLQALFDYLWDTDLWDNDGERIEYGGTYIDIISHELIPITVNTEYFNDGRVIQEVLAPKGVNAFVEDNNTNYIFSMKKMGWANIDRLYDDPRTKEIDMVTEVKNKDAFKTVYITLMFQDKNIYLSGYEMKNGTYCFSHSDYEKTALPVGEKAIVLATGYKGGNPYVDIQKVTIADELTISMNLQETTMEELKDRLDKEI